MWCEGDAHCACKATCFSSTPLYNLARCKKNEVGVSMLMVVVVMMMMMIMMTMMMMTMIIKIIITRLSKPHLLNSNWPSHWPRGTTDAAHAVTSALEAAEGNTFVS